MDAPTTRATSCAVCGRDLRQPARGRPRRYCGGACRQAALVRRKRGVPERLPRSGPRGRTAFNASDVARWGRRLAIDRALRIRPMGAGSDLSALEARRKPMEWWRKVDEDLAEVPHAFVGAAAANAYMAPRLTRDLDVAVAVADRARAEECLLAHGYERGGDLSMSLDPRLEGSRWTSSDGEQVDLIVIGHRWAGAAIGAANGSRLDDLPFMTLPYLVLMKLITSRSVDVADLQRVLGAASEEQWRQARELVAGMRPDDLDDLDALRQIGLWERTAG